MQVRVTIHGFQYLTVPDGLDHEEIEEAVHELWHSLNGNDIAEMVSIDTITPIRLDQLDVGYVAGLVGQFWSSSEGQAVKNGMRLD